MTTQYTRNVLKMVVAQICQTIGWHSINSTPLEFMVDLMQEYIIQLSKVTQQYAQVLGRSEANLDDLGLAFGHMNIDLQELAEYVRNVDSVPCVVAVPKLPIHRDSHLNFLKPGSREVVTRPVYVHEHLPPMHPASEDEYSTEVRQTDSETTVPSNETTNISEEDSIENITPIANGHVSEESSNKVSPQAVFKRPGDPVSFDGPVVKRAKTTDEGRPLREIHSVIMTTSGFLSTAREGKLPEARTPQQARVESPPPPVSYPEPPLPPPEVTKVEKKIKKKASAGSEDGGKPDKENKKKKIPKDILFKPDEIKTPKVKKLAGMKELAKLKVLKGTKVGSPNLAGPSAGKMVGDSPKHMKNAIPKMKAEKNIDVMQHSGVSMFNDIKEEPVDKLPIEPDKQKLNIFKKISSKPRDDKDRDMLDPQQKYKDLNSRENSSIITLDDDRYHNNVSIKQEDKKTNFQSPVINNNVLRVPGAEDAISNMMSPGSDVYMFDDLSSPGTPSTPKTPELNLPNVPFEKKKKKDKSGKKKEPKIKTPKSSISPKKARWSNDSGEMAVPDRPKTPQGPEHPLTREINATPTLPMSYPFPTTPGLIPPPMFPMLPMPKDMMRPPMVPGMLPNMLQQRFLPPYNYGPGLIPRPRFPIPPMPRGIPNVLNNPVMPGMPPPALPRPRFVKPEPPKIEDSKPAVIVQPPIQPAAPMFAEPLQVVKTEKTEKSEKKSKEHKKEKKEKMKKKKEKKEKHKDKGEKVEEKKEKIKKKDKLERMKEKKEKKEKKRKEKEVKKEESVPKLTLKLGPAGGSPRPPTPDSALMKKITIKPPKRPEDETKREPTPELAKISALVTRPPKQKSKSKPEAVPKKEETKEDRENGRNALAPVATVTTDATGKQVWICPSCGKQDDGSPMIGCDDCDAWYHWVCVGIQVEPAENTDWYCRFCIAKKQEQYHDKKKKKRKKKNREDP